MIAVEPMLLRHVHYPETKQFVPRNEAVQKNHHSKRLKSFNGAGRECQCLHYISDGKKSGWLIYPVNDYPDTGSLFQFNLNLNIQHAGCKHAPGNRSNTSMPGFIIITKLFLNNVSVFSKPRVAGLIFSLFCKELFSRETGYVADVNHVPGQKIFLSGKAPIRHHFYST